MPEHFASERRCDCDFGGPCWGELKERWHHNGGDERELRNMCRFAGQELGARAMGKR